MTSYFDGLAGTLSDIFGSLIRYEPAGGPARDVQSVFRASPIEVTGADGQILRIDAPSWRVRHNLVPELARGDMIEVSGKGRFKIMVPHNSGSPAVDAFALCELHREVTP